MSLHADLIAQARHLCQKEPRRPKQASLRRAVSAAYYGLFHCPVSSAAASFLSHRHRALRPPLMRVFKHREMAEACQRLLKLKAQPAAMAPFVGGAALSPDLETVAVDAPATSSPAIASPRASGSDGSSVRTTPFSRITSYRLRLDPRPSPQHHRLSTSGSEEETHGNLAATKRL